MFRLLTVCTFAMHPVLRDGKKVIWFSIKASPHIQKEKKKHPLPFLHKVYQGAEYFSGE